VISKKRLLFNAATFIPGMTHVPLVKRVLARREFGTCGTDCARYCYSVWLRHLVSAAESGLNCDPRAIAELGPGDSLGIGIAAVLTGAERYSAFDIVLHANTERNLSIAAELIELFRAHADIPDNTEFPNVGPTLNDYRFPGHILTEERMRRALDPVRLDRIRRSLRDCASRQSMIQYRVPWSCEGAVERDSLDLVYSQATLEHIDNLQDVYRAMHQWLKPGAYMSHQIDFSCHDSAVEWNGHWTYSDLMWKLVRGKDTWLINRLPHSAHLELMRSCGFRIASEQCVRKPSSVSRQDLAARFRSISDDDLVTSVAFIQAVKPAEATRDSHRTKYSPLAAAGGR
jgi:SAM-dependent methyltransferase